MKNISKRDHLDPDIQAVKSVMKDTKDVRLFKRYQAILMYLKGQSNSEIAGFLGCTQKTVYNYVNAYKSDGLEGLIPGHSPGRPQKLTEKQEQILCDLIVNQTPADVGFPATMNWTSLLVRDWINKNFDIQYTDRGVRILLRRLGFSYTRPSYTLAKADPEKQEAFKADFDNAKKNEGW